MKNGNIFSHMLVLIFFIVIYKLSLCQEKQKKYRINTKTIECIKLSSMLVSGTCDGLREAMKFYPDKFSKSWNINNTWRNKYKNRDPAQGEKFPGSTTIFVSLTDNYHLVGGTGTIFDVSHIVCVVYTIDGNKKRFAKRAISESIKYFVIHNFSKTITMQYFKNK